MSRYAIRGFFLAILVAGAFVCPALRGQSVAQSFDVSTVKPSNAGTSSSSGITTGHGLLDAKNVTVKRCIMGAYGIGPHQLSGGPDWVASDRFDILAKADPPVDSDDALMVMLQGLLADRFKLAMHRETRTMSAFVLEVARSGAKLEKANGGESVTNTSSSNARIMIDARNADMESFAKILAREMNLPVVNRTGLAGVFNLKLNWTPEMATPAKDGTTETVSIFTAIQEQLGLRLREEKVPVEVLVIDHVEPPSEN